MRTIARDEIGGGKSAFTETVTQRHCPCDETAVRSSCVVTLICGATWPEPRVHDPSTAAARHGLRWRQPLFGPRGGGPTPTHSSVLTSASVATAHASTAPVRE
jgi:hypothetical protein